MTESFSNLTVKECPQCGATVEIKNSCCSYCKSEFYVRRVGELGNKANHYKSFYNEILKNDGDNIEAGFGLGLCFISLNFFDRAKTQFDQIIKKDPEHVGSLFHYCIAVIAGRKIKTMQLKEIKEVENNLSVCLLIEPNNSLYKRALAHVKYDYYVLNGLKQSAPSFEELEIESIPINSDDTEILMKYFKSKLITNL